MSGLSRLAFIWAGLVLGVSFIATPAKFQAGSLSLATALEVGRATFRTMAVAEVGLIAIGIFLIIRSKNWRTPFWIAPVVFAIEWGAIMPLLSARTDAVLAGQERPGGQLHVVFIVLELVKIVALLWCGLGPRKAAP